MIALKWSRGRATECGRGTILSKWIFIHLFIELMHCFRRFRRLCCSLAQSPYLGSICRFRLKLKQFSAIFLGESFHCRTIHHSPCAEWKSLADAKPIKLHRRNPASRECIFRLDFIALLSSRLGRPQYFGQTAHAKCKMRNRKSRRHKINMYWHKL